MSQTSIIINTTAPDGKALQKTLTDVNNECGSYALKTFSQMLNGLTQNTYVKTTRIGKVVVDNESIPSAGKYQPITVGEFATVQPQFLSGSGAKAFKASISGAEGGLACSPVTVFSGDEGGEDYTFGFINDYGNELRIECKTDESVTGFLGYVIAWEKNVSRVDCDIHYLPTCVEFEYGDVE